MPDFAQCTAAADWPMEAPWNFERKHSLILLMYRGGAKVNYTLFL